MARSRSHHGGLNVWIVRILQSQLDQCLSGERTIGLSKGECELVANANCGIVDEFEERFKKPFISRMIGEERFADANGMFADGRMRILKSTFCDVWRYRTQAIERAKGLQTSFGICAFGENHLQRFGSVWIGAFDKKPLSRVALPTVRTVKRLH